MAPVCAVLCGGCTWSKHCCSNPQKHADETWGRFSNLNQHTGKKLHTHPRPNTVGPSGPTSLGFFFPPFRPKPPPPPGFLPQSPPPPFFFGGWGGWGGGGVNASLGRGG